MRTTKNQSNGSAEKTVKAIRRATRRQYAAEEKIRIVLEGLRGEESIAELCRRVQINQNLYYRWPKEFLEAGKKRLAGDTKREATGAALSALWYLGKNNVTPETVATIAAALGSAEFEKLRSADMPAWIAKALGTAARETIQG